MTVQRQAFDTLLEPINQTSSGIEPLILQRHSRGSYLAEEPTWQELAALLNAARCAPSFFNRQPWAFIVVTEGERKDAINQALHALGADWAAEAPVLIALVATPHEGTDHEGTNYTLLDCGAALQNLLLQASALDLAAHPVVCQDRNQIAQLLHVPEEHELLLFVTVGYPGEAHRETNASRLRKPLAAMASWEHWHGPAITG